MPLKLDRVGHHFAGGPWLFRDLDYTMLPGQVYALTGPSGSGKSTLLSIAAQWVNPTEGSVQYQGIEKVSWVFQNPHGVPRRTALSHVMVPLLAHGLSVSDAEKKALDLLDSFGLAHVAEQNFSALSGGEAQRLMLARGSASAPDLFLVDEPTAQLDLVTRREVNAVITSLSSSQTIVVIATHDEETRDACSTIIDLRNYQPDPTREQDGTVQQ